MELRATFRRLSVPDSAYSIGRETNEAYCLIEEVDGWHVYYSERGNRNAEQVFSSESAAAEELMLRVLDDGAVRRSIDAPTDRAN
jgi:hypothetical protein